MSASYASGRSTDMRHHFPRVPNRRVQRLAFAPPGRKGVGRRLQCTHLHQRSPGPRERPNMRTRRAEHTPVLNVVITWSG